MENLKPSHILNYLLLFVLVVMMNIMMNMQKPEKVSQTPTEKPKPEVVVKEVEVETTPLVNLTNNEKAALFLLIPLVGFAFSIDIGVKKSREKKEIEQEARRILKFKKIEPEKKGKGKVIFN